MADKPLAECTADFWSTPLSPARLRALPPATPRSADLLLRSLEPPMITVGGLDLVTLLRPAYLVMAGADGDDRGENGADQLLPATGDGECEFGGALGPAEPHSP